MTPVSARLEADLRDAVRRHGLVVWLDPAGQYTAFADRLRARRAEAPEQLPFTLVGYRGSYLALILDADGQAAGADPTPLVVHLPGFDLARVRASPALELYAAGRPFERRLDALVTDAAAGLVHPDAVAEFLTRPGPSLSAADAWLASLLDQRGGGLAAQLGAMSLPALVDDLLSGGFVARKVTSAESLDVIWETLAARAGMPAGWRDRVLTSRPVGAEDVAFGVCAWALCVEYVFDLTRAPVAALLAPARGLPSGVVAACRELAGHLRQRHPRAYVRWADEAEAWLADERSIAKPSDLGKIDTFRFEEDVVLAGALVAMQEEPEAWRQVLVWAEPRLTGGSFWVDRDDARLAAWQLLGAAARLGLAIAEAGPRLDARDLASAVGRYTRVGAPVDTAHRHLAQLRVDRGHALLAERDAVRTRVAEAAEAWREWADNWARDFNALCRRVGFLPASGLQQRTLFDEVVRPLAAEPGVTAFLVVDALRYEMGVELFAALADTPASAVRLHGRLAELPTVTEVGMNALAPVVSSGRLRATLRDGRMAGFSTGEFRVTDRETRRRAMADRVGGGTCPKLTLEEVETRDVTSLKQAIARANLVVVFSDEFDEAGEAGVGPHAFSALLRKLRSGWQRLREAGVRRFVITADHGYLLLDDTAHENAQPHGRKIHAKRRHAFSTVAADHTGESRVALADLGYDGVTEHLMFPDSTAVFQTGRRDLGFVHGGNSLQERVIPVLTLVHRAPAGAATQRYTLVVSARGAVAGLHCVAVQVMAADQEGLPFGGVGELDLDLGPVDAPQVQLAIADLRGASRGPAGAIRAPVSREFEVFFRLTGSAEARVRVQLRHVGTEAAVEPASPEAWFDVQVPAGRAFAEAPAPAPVADWLDLLPEGGPRQVFAHLALHGAVTEAEAQGMFQSPRGLRAFALAFESHAAKAPFVVGIETVGGVKRYVRGEGRG